MASSDFDPGTPWPRHWYNFPIILCGIVLQYVWALAICFDAASLDATGLHSLLFKKVGSIGPYPWYVIAVVVVALVCSATTCLYGFFVRRKLYSMLCFLPQQFLLLLSTWGVVHSVSSGTFADGTVRTIAFLAADQSPVLLLTIFHTWAIILILIHSEDPDDAL